jgi:hypothetical protein
LKKIKKNTIFFDFGACDWDFAKKKGVSPLYWEE